jgi:hypothetical protein
MPSMTAMINYTPFDTLEIWKNFYLDRVVLDLPKSEYFIEMYDTCFKKKNK